MSVAAQAAQEGVAGHLPAAGRLHDLELEYSRRAPRWWEPVGQSEDSGGRIARPGGPGTRLPAPEPLIVAQEHGGADMGSQCPNHALELGGRETRGEGAVRGGEF